MGRSVSESMSRVYKSCTRTFTPNTLNPNDNISAGSGMHRSGVVPTLSRLDEQSSRCTERGFEMNNNLTGRLLIASPYLSDGHFMRSVVFIIRHELDGAFGLIINRPSKKQFRELFDDMSESPKMRDDDFLFVGGPVPGPVMALHDLAGIGDPCGVHTGDDQADLKPGETITQGVKHTIHDHPAEPWGSMSLDLGNPPAWITADEDHLKILLKRSDANVRYFKDYSGWGPGQLDEELKVGGWLIGDANEDILFGSYDAAWETAVKQCGQKILDDIAPHSSTSDPNLN